AGGHCPVADHRYGAPVQPLQSGCDGHAETGTDGGAGVADAEGVIGAFAAPREGGQAVLLPQSGHLFAAAGEDLVWIGLMADIPDQAIFRRLIDIVQSDGQLDHAQSGAEMTTGLTNSPEQEQTQLVRQFRQARYIQLPQLGGAVNAVQQGGAGTFAGYFVESTRHLMTGL